MIEKTSFVVENVQNNVAEIDDNPPALVHTFFSADFAAVLFDLVDSVISQSAHLR